MQYGGRQLQFSLHDFHIWSFSSFKLGHFNSTGLSSLQFSLGRSSRSLPWSVMKGQRFPCGIQYYLSDICTLMLPVCFQFPALTHNYLYCHLFKQCLRGKEINFSPCCVLCPPYSGNQRILTARSSFQTLHYIKAVAILYAGLMFE